MNSAHAFSYATSGSYTEAQMSKHTDYIHQSLSVFQNAGGWLAEQANKTMDGFNKFLSSKAWELGKRLLNKQDGEFVSRFEIGYLGSVDAILGAEGYMRDYIMAHPGLHQDYLDETFGGFDGEFHKLCSGVGEQNPFYRKAMNGLLNLETVDDVTTLRHTHYNDSMGGGLSFRDRVNIQKTWSAVSHHRAKGLFTITSDKTDTSDS